MGNNRTQVLCVHVPGFVYASVTADQLANPDGEAEGILIGTCDVRTSVKVTDNADPEETEHTTIRVMSFREGDLFKGLKLFSKNRQNQGTVGIERWIMDDEKMIGWYRFGRDRPLSPTLQECIMHKKLLERCSQLMPFSEDLFVFLTMTGGASESKGLFHSFQSQNIVKNRFRIISSSIHEKKGGSLMMGNYRRKPSDYQIDTDRLTASFDASIASAAVEASTKLCCDLEADVSRLVSEIVYLQKDICDNLHHTARTDATERLFQSGGDNTSAPSCSASPANQLSTATVPGGDLQKESAVDDPGEALEPVLPSRRGRKRVRRRRGSPRKQRGVVSRRVHDKKI